MIKKIQGKYVVLSEKTGRSFGRYTTKAEAEHRLGQIEMFKHMKSGDTKRPVHKRKKIIVGCIAVLALVIGPKMVFAQTKATDPTPAVSIVDITSTLYPSSLPSGGGSVTFTFKIADLGKASLNDVAVTDDHCSAMSGELGDINDNHLLDPNETWIYTCTIVLTKTTTHSATVTAYANGLKATATEIATINIPGANTTSTSRVPGLPNNGTNPKTLNVTVLIWEILGAILAVLIVIYIVITRKKK